MANSSKIFILILLTAGIICSLVLIPAAETRAWEVMTGRISSMHTDGDKIKLTVQLNSQTPNPDSTNITPQSKTGPDALKNDPGKPAANTIELEIENRDLPPQLKEGDYIRIWSKADSPQKPWRISCNRGHDPTGVRSRLRRHGRRSGRGSCRGGGKGGHGGH